MSDCVFCDKIADGDYEWQSTGVVVFEPLNPVTPGHRLVVPRAHIPDAVARPGVSAAVMMVAAMWARYHDDSGADGFNFITSVGEAATQSVFHLHLHVVPRRVGDGLPLPWTPQQEGR